MLKIQRIYGSEPEAGTYRILVDRLWPRGISKVKAQLDLWAKEVAPSTDLRKWFNHDEAKFPEFKTRYLAEIKANPAMADFVATVKAELAKGDVVLLYGAKDQQDNQAQVLLKYLQAQL
jgi:Uncharacterized conserved protein